MDFPMPKKTVSSAMAVKSPAKAGGALNWESDGGVSKRSGRAAILT